MFRWQCQETADGKDCSVSSVCGKKPDVAAMRDLLVCVTKGLSCVRGKGVEVGKDINHSNLPFVSASMANPAARIRG